MNIIMHAAPAVAIGLVNAGIVWALMGTALAMGASQAMLAPRKPG